jgi:hypothetical protein
MLKNSRIDIWHPFKTVNLAWGDPKEIQQLSVYGRERKACPTMNILSKTQILPWPTVLEMEFDGRTDLIVVLEYGLVLGRVFWLIMSL